MKKIILLISIIFNISYSNNLNLFLIQTKVGNIHNFEKEISKIIDAGQNNLLSKSGNNPRNYDLSNPYIYLRKSSILPLSLYTIYYYSKIDSIVRESQYRWTTNKTIFKGLNLKEWEKEFRVPEKKLEYYDTMYLKVKSILIDKFGKPLSNQDSLKKGENDYVTIPSFTRESNWKSDSLKIRLHYHYGAVAQISINIEWDYDNFDNTIGYGFKVFKDYEVDVKPIDIDLIDIEVPTKYYSKYKDKLKIATILISKTGSVEKVSFYRNDEKLNKILSQEIRKLNFTPAVKDDQKVRCLINLGIKLTINT